MGLLPQLAHDLLPHDGRSADSRLADAGHLVSAYALGVFIGAPVIGVLAARIRQNVLALVLLASLIVTNVLTAVVGGLYPSMVIRFLAGVPHGAFLGVASLLAGALLGPGMQGKGVAFALSGLTVANVIGVPLATGLGQAAGWRWVFVSIALIFALALVVLWRVLPRVPGDPGSGPVSELKAFTRLRFWLVMGIGTVGFGAFFSIYAYLGRAATGHAGVAEAAVPYLLAAIGLGMVLGNIVGGWGADRNMRLTTAAGLGTLICALILYLLLAHSPVGIFVSAFLVGFGAWIVTPAAQSWLITAAGKQRLLGAAMNHASFNLANSIGAWAGGAVLAAGWGSLAPAWVGIGLACGGLVILIISLAYERARGTI